MVVSTQIHAQQAVDLALRVADEMDVNIGHEVGYSIPLETCGTGDTVLRYADAAALCVVFLYPILSSSRGYNEACSPPLFFLLSRERERVNKRLVGALFRGSSTAARLPVCPYVTLPHVCPS